MDMFFVLTLILMILKIIQKLLKFLTWFLKINYVLMSITVQSSISKQPEDCLDGK